MLALGPPQQQHQSIDFPEVGHIQIWADRGDGGWAW
jgi:hypothetical protein